MLSFHQSEHGLTSVAAWFLVAVLRLAHVESRLIDTAQRHVQMLVMLLGWHYLFRSIMRKTRTITVG